MSIALPKPLRRSLSNIPLRWVLTVPFVLLTLGTTGLIGYLSYRNGQEAVENLGVQLAAQTNDRVTQELKSYLRSPLLINRLNVDMVNQGQLNLQNTPALEAALFNRSQQFEQVTAILFVSPEGKLRLVERSSGLYSVGTDPPRPNKLQIYQLDNIGRRKRQVPAEGDIDVRDRSWYKQAITTGKPGWDSVGQYGSSETLSIAASQPVYDRTTKRLLGVFTVHLRLDYVSDFLSGLEISRAGQVLIMDHNGDLIAASTREKLYELRAGTGARQQFKQLKIHESQNALTRSLSEQLRNRSLDQPQFFEFKHNGQLHYVKVTLFRDQDGLDWRILTTIPKSHFMGAIEHNTHITASLCVLALGGAIALGVIAANKLSDRFKQLTQASQALAAGNLNQRLLADSIPELNSLSQTFNQMADQLQSAFDRLQSNLAESEEKFAVIFHSSPDPIALIAIPEGRCIEANESLLNLLEYSRDALIGQVFLELGVWVNLEERTHLLQALQQQGYVRNLEVQFITRTQQIKTVLISAELIELNDETYSLSIVRDISDRKHIEDERRQAQAALQESETRFRQLAENVREGFFVFETESAYYSYVNPAYAAIMGKPSQFFYGGMFHWLNHIHPDDRDRIEAALERERRGENFSEEYRFVRPDGEVRWLRSKAFPIQNETGTVIRVVGTVEDISDAKQREAEREATAQALQQIKERYRLATRAAKVGVWEWNLQTNHVYTDPTIKALLGYRDDEIQNNLEGWMELVHPNDRAMIMSASQAHLKGATSEYVLEHRLLCKDGSMLWMLARGQVIRDQQGNPERLIGTDTDITDLKHAQEALRQSENRFRQLAFASPSVIYTMVEDATTPIRFEYLSPAFETIHEVPVAVALQDARIVAEQMHLDDRASYRQAVEQSIATMRAFSHEWRIITPSGKLKWLQANSQPQRRGHEIVWHGVAQDVTHRKQAEAEIQQLNQQLTDRVNELQILFNVLPIGVAISEDPECQFVRVNPCLSKLLRVPMDANASPSAPDFDRPTYQVYKDGQAVSSENLPMQYAAIHNVEIKDEIFDIVHPDGTVINLLSYAAPLRDEQGKVRGVIGGFADITDRKRTEIALQESEARFQEIAQTINQVFYVVDLTTGQYLYISPAYERLWGYSSESLYQNPRSWLDRIHPEDMGYVLWGFDQLLSGSQIQLEYRIIDAKGEVHWIKSESSVVRDENGKPVRMVGLADDISTPKQLEEALRASKERFRRAFDDAPIGIALVALNGRFLRVNRSLCDLLKYSQAELLERGLQDIAEPDSAEVYLNALQQLLNGETQIFQTEKRYLQKQGNIIHGSLSVSLVKSQENQPLYFIAQIQDISDRYQVERMKDEFISVVSHELRTPLTSIRGALGILESGVFQSRPEKAQHMLHVALQNCDRLVRLVNDILTLERLTSGKVSLIMEHCQVTDLMQQAINSVGTLADQSGITLCLTPLSTALWAAPDAIVQTLTNLLSNAIKFSTSGDTVWLKAEAIEQDDLKISRQIVPNVPTPYVLFSVRDQGRGIPQDKLEMIFEQFQQVDVSDSRKKGGTGLGLSICKQIVQQHHGQIWAESCLGEGSTFYVALPSIVKDEIY